MPIYMEYLLQVINLSDFIQSCPYRLNLQKVWEKQNITKRTLFHLYPENTLKNKIKLCCHD